MDYLRSAYSTKMRLREGDTRLSDVTWYRAPDGALFFPERHSFGSHNWNTKLLEDPPLTIGEVPGELRSWSNGATPAGTVGTNFCGSVSDYQVGISAFRTTDIPLNAFGQFNCCLVPCQPFGGVPTAYATGPSYGPNPADAPSSTAYTWTVRLTPTRRRIFATRTTVAPCPGSSSRTTSAIRDDGGGGTVSTTLVGYNAATRTGTWLVPGSAAFWAGQTYTLRMPV